MGAEFPRGRDIPDEILLLVERIRAGDEEPLLLGRFAVEQIVAFSMINLDEEVADLLHLAIEFEENPSMLLLNLIERRARMLSTPPPQGS
jgi:hypothetical protein